jgi:hypothetical protein
MAQNDNAVVVAAQGYVFTNTPGALAPTPAELAALDPETFGAQVQTVAVTGAPTGGSFTVKNAVGDTPAEVPFNATKDQLRAAVESLESVGAGNADVSGTSLSAGYEVSFIGTLQGSALPALTIDDAGLIGGTSPEATATITKAPNGWNSLGHTSRDDMPEFGFDGGDTSVKGSWQKKRLREVATGDPVADFVNLNLEQWDKPTLELYYGEDAAGTPGVFGVSGEFIPLEKALLIILVDGPAKIGFYAAKASVKRTDSINLPIDDLASLPVKATFLNLGTHRLYDWINEDLFAA